MEFKKWCEGKTGCPMVDAGMRELNETGYMHNRVRMIAASFLVKHLRIHWKQGESWFWDTLLDADAASDKITGLFFDRQGLRAVQGLPVKAGLRPRLLSPEAADSLLEPRRLGFRCETESCRPVENPPPVDRSGLFWGGQIDLTGDGVPEKVRRIAGQVIIYQEEREVWRSPAGW